MAEHPNFVVVNDVFTMDEPKRVTFKDALSNYLEAEFKKCISILSELIRDVNDPYYYEATDLITKAKKIKEQKELGDSLYDEQNFLKAEQTYREALDIDPLNEKIQSILHRSLAETNFNLLDYTQGVKNATASLKHDPKYIKALAIRAKCYFKLKSYNESSIDCKSILLIAANDDIKKLYKDCDLENSKRTFSIKIPCSSKSELFQDKVPNPIAIKALLIKANQHFKKKEYKECFNCCNLIVRNTIEGGPQNLYKIALLLLKKIRLYITEVIDQAKRNFIQHNYHQCILDCKNVLNIDESVKVRNLLETASTEKDINDRMSRIRKYNKSKSYKHCIKECIDILKIRKIPEAIQILKNIRDIIANFMAQAKRNLNLEYFDQCIKDCEKILNIEKSKQAEDYINAAKMGKSNKIKINVGLDRARNFYSTKHLQDCINECKDILKIKEVDEAFNLIEMCEAELKETRDLQRKAEIKKNKLKYMMRANQHLKNGKYEECIAECELILLCIDFEPAKILMKKAKALLNERILKEIMERARNNLNQRNFKECIQECQKALVIDRNLEEAKTLINNAKIEIENAEKNFVKNEKISAELHFSKAQYKECIEKCFNILKREDLLEVRDMLEKSKIEFNYQNLTSYRDILKVDEHANKKAIITSFRSLSLKYHPDKHSNSTKEMYNHCEKIFKKLITAYRELMKLDDLK